MSPAISLPLTFSCCLIRSVGGSKPFSWPFRRLACGRFHCQGVPGCENRRSDQHGEAAFVRSTLAAGALGYVLKRSPNDQLIAAVRKAALNRRFIDQLLSDTVVTDS